MPGLLQQYELFRDFRTGELQKLERLSKIRDYASGELVYEQNSPCREVFLLVEGRVKLFHRGYGTNGNGNHGKIVQFLEGGEVFCLSSLLTEDSYLTNAESCGESLLASIPAVEILRYIQSNRLLLWRISCAAARNSWNLLERMVSLTDYNAEQRLAAYLLNRNGSGEKIKTKNVDLANYLCLTPETLSRCLKKLKSRNAVEVTDGRIKVRDSEILARMLNTPSGK